MRKKIIPMMVGAMIASCLPVSSAFALPPVYVANKKEDLMITRINLRDGSFEIQYHAEKHLGDVPVYVNFQLGGVSDYDLHYLEDRDVTKTMYKNKTSAFISGGMKDGDLFVVPDRLLYYRAKLSMNTSEIIDYYVSFANSEPQRARADYRRCVDASVFNANTMECVLEDLGNGYIAYQPYTFDGERVEIPEAEDLRLLTQTENWRATPGNWGDEWYVEPEPEPVEPEPEPVEPEPKPEPEPVEPEPEPEPVEPEPDPVEPEPIEPEPVNPEPVRLDPVEPEPVSPEPVEPELVEPDSVEPDPVEQEPIKLEQELESESEPKLELEPKSIEPGLELGSKIETTDTSTITDVVGVADTTGQKLAATVTGDGVENQKQDDSLEGSKEQEVGIPDLGKETGGQPNWTAIILISLASVAGLVGWFFLIFGKNKFKKRKEGKE